MEKLLYRTMLVGVILMVGFSPLVNIPNRFYVARGDNDVSDVQDELEKTMEKKQQAEANLLRNQTLYQRNQHQMNTTKSLIDQTENNISRQEAEVENLNKKGAFNKNLLLNYLREVYYSDQDIATLGFSFSEESLADWTKQVDSSISIKEKLVDVLEEINNNREDIEVKKNELEDKVQDHEQLLQVQEGISYEFKQNINEVQATLSELNAQVDKLRGQLASLLGTSVSFKNIMDAAKYASNVTGIRKDYLLGVLVVESNLGRYTGGCTFEQSRMSSSRAKIFKDICSDLDYNYKKMKVSCPPSGYKGTGGAMGVAQFMPDTWRAYESRIASVTGNKTPDPWSLTDGVVAMAIKLTQVSGVTDHKKSAEAKAYCIYLAGGNWAAYCDNKGVNYGEKVLYWADNYEKLIK